MHHYFAHAFAAVQLTITMYTAPLPLPFLPAHARIFLSPGLAWRPPASSTLRPTTFVTEPVCNVVRLSSKIWSFRLLACKAEMSRRDSSGERAIPAGFRSEE